MNKNDLVTIRDIAPGDRNFIFSTWLNGLFYGDSWFSEIPKAIFTEVYRGVIDGILSNPNTEVKIACLKDDPDVILGYSVCHKFQGFNHLDWVFVKASWRRIGIGKSLVPNDIHAVTHLTKVGRALKPKNVIFNPFAIG